MHDEVTGQTGFWNTQMNKRKNTHTHGINSICSSAIFWRGHKNLNPSYQTDLNFNSATILEGEKTHLITKEFNT